jgi:hypothetical protein
VIDSFVIGGYRLGIENGRIQFAANDLLCQWPDCKKPKWWLKCCVFSNVPSLCRDMKTEMAGSQDVNPGSRNNSTPGRPAAKQGAEGIEYYECPLIGKGRDEVNEFD